MGRWILILLAVATVGYLGSMLPPPFVALQYLFGPALLGAFVLSIFYLIRKAPWWVLWDKPSRK